MKRIIILFLLIGLSATAAAYSFADTNSGNGAGTNAGESTAYMSQFYNSNVQSRPAATRGQPGIILTTLKIFLYTGVFALIAFLLIRYIIAKNTPPSSEDQKVVDLLLTTTIGAGTYLQIVKIGPSYYLLSLSSGGARLIDRITDKETIDYIELNKEDLKPKDTKFFNILEIFPGVKKAGKLDFLNKQKDRLKKL